MPPGTGSSFSQGYAVLGDVQSWKDSMALGSGMAVPLWKNTLREPDIPRVPTLTSLRMVSLLFGDNYSSHLVGLFWLILFS